MRKYDALVIGAGIGGLTAAALLAHSGRSVLLLEGHTEPGGCASSFQRKCPDASAYVFDVGATLFGGFQPGGAHTWVAQRLGVRFPVVPVEPAMQVWLPDRVVTRYGNAARWRSHRRQVFAEQAEQAERFWRRQEQIADIAWRFATRHPPMPPETGPDLLHMAGAVRPDTFALLPHMGRTVGHELRRIGITDRALRTFIDAQLLISAQVIADECAWLYGSVALDLARQGVFYAEGGAWSIARTLADAFIRDGGDLRYRTWVTKILVEHRRAVGVQTDHDEQFFARHIIANVTLHDIRNLLGDTAPRALRRTAERLPDGWSAFMLYLGIDEQVIPPNFCTHHQIIVDDIAPPGEGNSVFLSLNPAFDASRAPSGQRALTVSTHTRTQAWQDARQQGRAAYVERKDAMSKRVLDTIERALPDIRKHIRFMQSGTPVTFQRYTHRDRGMVGGLGQSLEQSGFASIGIRAPRIPGLWLVGDNTFPGQSTAAVTQSGIRVWQEVLRALQRTDRRTRGNQ